MFKFKDYLALRYTTIEGKDEKTKLVNLLMEISQDITSYCYALESEAFQAGYRKPDEIPLIGDAMLDYMDEMLKTLREKKELPKLNTKRNEDESIVYKDWPDIVN